MSREMWPITVATSAWRIGASMRQSLIVGLFLGPVDTKSASLILSGVSWSKSSSRIMNGRSSITWFCVNI